MDALNKRLDDFSNQLTSIPFLAAMRDGLGSTWLLLGAISFLSISISFPIKAYQNFMVGTSVYEPIRSLALLLMDLYLILTLLATSYH